MEPGQVLSIPLADARATVTMILTVNLAYIVLASTMKAKSLVAEDTSSVTCTIVCKVWRDSQDMSVVTVYKLCKVFVSFMNTINERH